jgi:hypothetical protein
MDIARSSCLSGTTLPAMVVREDCEWYGVCRKAFAGAWAKVFGGGEYICGLVTLAIDCER